ncbi:MULTISPECIES: aminotransferase class III-fold pyridoxal phosphate-dependent enzyme [Streptomyces]|uniref:Diaminobutyrate--2-oxoglutarate transaminase n=1 Tax=Streptomyces griseosporeus TaxID=1910 RepID=A0ABV3KW47_STRGS|nr:aminotransferase class III-fold pyridoxal phosphate-dependent enzyme [Streptomyces actuosus]
MTVIEGIPRRQPVREPAARTYARSLPVVPVRARGLTIEGADGRRYLDCLSGAGTLPLGHNHPVVLEAVRKVLDSGAPLHVLGVATPVEDAFVAELVRTLPPGLARHARVEFCGPAARDAVDAALRLVRAASGRPGILAFTGAHHGAAADPVGSASGAGTLRLPYPQDYRCPFGIGGPQGAELAARWAESLLDDPLSGLPRPAGMIVEAVQGEGGVLPAPDAWLRRMRRITAERSLPLIADEIHTGVGRTGAFWAVQHSGVTPDVMVLSDAIGGSLPLSAIVYRDDLATARPGDRAPGPRGNQLAMAAGAATLSYVRENRLPERAADLGTRMLSRLRALADAFPCVGEVRGRGLMIGVELVREEGAGAGASGGAVVSGGGVTSEDAALAFGGGVASADAALVPCGGVVPGDAALAPGSGPVPRPAAPELAAAVQRECLRRGLIVGLGGRHASVVRLLPPLTITDEQATAVLDRLADAVQAAALRTPSEEAP